MGRNFDGAGLLLNVFADVLLYPIHRIRGKTIALLRLKLFYGLQQAQVALFNQIHQLHAGPLETLGRRNDQAQIHLHHFIFGGLIAFFYPGPQRRQLLAVDFPRDLAQMLKIFVDAV